MKVRFAFLVISFFLWAGLRSARDAPCATASAARSARAILNRIHIL